MIQGEPNPAPLSSAGMILREKEPANLEMPFASLGSYITPVACFYVRCHHPIPQVNPKTWLLQIEGDVDHPYSVDLAELAAMETRTITTTMWDYSWAVPASPGEAVLMARATDSDGHTQPSAHHDDSGSYLIHHCLPIHVSIR